MFDLRETAVSLAFFVLLYSLFSTLVVVAWPSFKFFHASERTLAALLFALRIFPFIASVIITFAFVIPSFQWLEPRSVDVDIHEGIGSMPLALGICALLLITLGCFRVIRAQRKTSRVVAGWLEGARPLDLNSDAKALTYQSKQAPPLTLVGFSKPKVLVSEPTLAALTHDELQIAIKHEIAHVKSHDNLKKLILRFCPFPGMSALEHTWSQAAELAADDAAVSSSEDAVDLAAALIKLSRFVPVEIAPVCTVGFVTGSIRVRVERLLAWNTAETRKNSTFLLRPWHALPLPVLLLSFVLATYGQTLVLTHRLTEWLVR
jgi:beta-lactamase regulating signal transducer with metallopeptidase domain